MFKYPKILLCLFAFLALPRVFLHAQERIGELPGLEWYKVFAGNNRYDLAKDMEQGPDGSIYYAGTYTNLLYVGIVGHADTLFQDTLVSTPYYSHGYVVKLDSAGVFQWAWIIRGGFESNSAVTDIVLDAEGEIWVTGWYQGAVDIPFGGNWATLGTNGFVLHLDANGEGSKFSQISGAGVVPRKLFIDPQQQIHLMLEARTYPISVGNDTIPMSTTCFPFLTIAKLDTTGGVVDYCYLGTFGTSQAASGQSTMDQEGNIYMIVWVYGDPITMPGMFVCGSDTMSMLGDNLVKINPKFQVEWTRRTTQIVSNYTIDLEATVNGEVYLAADTYGSFSPSKAFIERYNAKGQLVWKLLSGGYMVGTGDIALTKNFIYWSGYYQCDMSIDTVHFRIGELEPWPWTARTGYLCVVNRHTGKVVWVMSDATTNQDKRFGRMVANKDDNITVEMRVNTTLCTIDTLTLQVTSVDVPNNMIVRFDGKPFPIWPEVPDSMPDFLIWPNPSNGEFYVQVNEQWSAQTKIEIYNSSGQLLLDQELDGMQMKISLDLVSSQMLLIRVFDKQTGHKLTQRLVIRH